MNIVIRNYLAGSFLLERESKVWDAIIILDSDIAVTDFVLQHARRYLYLRFDDITFDTPNKRMATSADIQSALTFATGSERLMVCCRAGQSRSAAIAFLICHQQLGSLAAQQLLNPERHIPNSSIIERGARVVEDPVLQTFADWQAEHQQINLSDHYGDIESEFDDLVARGARNQIVR